MISCKVKIILINGRNGLKTLICNTYSGARIFLFQISSMLLKLFLFMYTFCFLHVRSMNLCEPRVSLSETRLVSSGVYLLIAAGGLMMVVGFLGCCGAIKESPCMLGLVSLSLQETTWKLSN